MTNIEYFLKKYNSLNFSEDSEYLHFLIKFKDRSLEKEEGYEIHHIIPRSYFDKNNLKIDNSSSNLIKLTIKEHIEAHWLLFKEKEEFGSAFAGVTGPRFFSKKYRELFTEEDLQKYAQLREEGFKLTAEKCKKTKNSEEWRTNFQKKNARFFEENPSFLIKNAEKLQNWKKTLSEEDFLFLEEKRLKSLKSPETSKKMSESAKNYFSTETKEHKEKRIQKIKKYQSQPEIKEKTSIRTKNNWQNLDYRNKYKEKIKEYWDDPINREHLKTRMNNPDTVKKARDNSSRQKFWIVFSEDFCLKIKNLSLFVDENFKLFEKTNFLRDTIYLYLSKQINISGVCAIPYEPELFKKIESDFLYRKNFLEEHSKKYLSKEEITKINSDSHKKYYESLSEEEKILKRKTTKEIMNMPKMKKYFQKKSEAWEEYKKEVEEGLQPPITWNTFSKKYKNN